MNALVEVKNTIQKMEAEFAKTLPAHIPSDKFIRTAQTTIQLNPQIAECDRQSVYASVHRAAQDGLILDGREAALVVYNAKQRDGTYKKMAQYIPMIAGIMKKVRNSGEIATWSVQAVYEKDQFDYELGDNESITHKPALGDRGKTIAFYSIVTLKSGEKSREVMGVGEVEAIRQRSKAKDSGPWVSDFAEMGKKTVARRHSKRLPMSTDLDDLIRRDDNLFATDKPVIDAEYSHDPAPDYENQSQDPADQGRSTKPKQTRASKIVTQKAAKAEEPKAEELPHDEETGEVIDAESYDYEHNEEVPV